MSDKLPTVPEAIDHLESVVKALPYIAQPHTASSIQVVLDELARVQAELNRAAGEIVVLRERVKEAVDKTRRCNTCSYPLQPAETVCPCCGLVTAEFKLPRT